MNSSMMRKRRRRCAPKHYQPGHSAAIAAETRFLNQAIQNSKLDKTRGGAMEIPYAPVFYPTEEDFKGNPLQYVEKIRPIAEKYGICKIVPPPGWNPGSTYAPDFTSTKKFETKHQLLHRLQEGISFGDGKEYNIADYQRIASARTKRWKRENYPDHDLLARHPSTNAGSNAESKMFTPESLEREYWDIVELSREVAVEYGNDVDTHEFGSGFPLSQRGRSINGTKVLEKMNEPEPEFGSADFYRETWWNLNNIPSAPDSVLRYVRVGINGINVPWLYLGSLYTTFCWHNEDNNLYSINYHHQGAPKQWYGVPGDKEAASGLEKVFKSYLSMKMRDVPDLLHHITTMFSPRLLQNQNVPVYKTLQRAGEFVITFPRAYHGGFSLGPNIGEAVNFATHDWISYGADANERYRSFARPAVFSHDRLTFTMANHLEDQKSYSNCKKLLEELELLVDEEMRLRRNLESTGVRDVSDMIHLPPNRLDQLDERSASYDDKRLCHACKHVCFFSAVACECSQTKVSCLRHSHFMCRCPTNRKYFMIWSTTEELKNTLERVRNHCESLEENDSEKETNVKGFTDESAKDEEKETDTTKAAPGVERDLEAHKNDSISTDAVTADTFLNSQNQSTGDEGERSQRTVSLCSSDDVVAAAAIAASSESVSASDAVATATPIEASSVSVGSSDSTSLASTNAATMLNVEGTLPLN